mmetsp:Transcript_45503/g.176982  ORF Transcript_45503/g.176982 Transcript_45503/m.176982 type:complete len:101 (+) Transcript_45503:2034-2336(+)
MSERPMRIRFVLSQLCRTADLISFFSGSFSIDKLLTTCTDESQGKLQHAIRFYLRGLELNPDASHVWSYVRTVLVADARLDLLPFVEQRDLEEFKKAIPF